MMELVCDSYLADEVQVDCTMTKPSATAWRLHFFVPLTEADTLKVHITSLSFTLCV